jgi:hypothetical protein
MYRCKSYYNGNIVVEAITNETYEGELIMNTKANKVENNNEGDSIMSIVGIKGIVTEVVVDNGAQVTQKITSEDLYSNEIVISSIVIPDINNLAQHSADIMRNALPKNLKVEVNYGPLPNHANDVTAVKLTNTARINQVRCYLLREFKKLPKDIKDEIQDMCPMYDTDLERVVDYVMYLSENNICSYDEDLVYCLNGTTSDKEARKYYKLIHEYRYDNLDMFASKRDDNFDPNIHIGAILDDEYYKKVYKDCIVIAIKSAVVKDNIFEVLDTKRFNRIKLGLKELGTLMWGGEEGRKTVTLGTNRVEKCLLFKLDKKYL